jgi:hypothetical protein
MKLRNEANCCGATPINLVGVGFTNWFPRHGEPVHPAVKQEKRRPAHSRKVSLRCSKAIATNMAGRGKLRTKKSRLQCWPRNAGANHPRRVGHVAAISPLPAERGS